MTMTERDVPLAASPRLPYLLSCGPGWSGWRLIVLPFAAAGSPAADRAASYRYDCQRAAAFANGEVFDHSAQPMTFGG